MTDLTEFLLARIAEDEAVASDAAHYLGKYGRPDDERWAVRQDESCSHDTGTGVWVLDSGRGGGRSEVVGNIDSPHVADHIARFDPAHVLAECEAKRRIVEAYRNAIGVCDFHAARGTQDGSRYQQAAVEATVLLPTLALLALPYADHPDYDPEWKP